MHERFFTFVSGNENKASQVGRYLRVSVDYLKLSMLEIQSLDPREVVVQKVRAAYESLGKPVMVDDSSLSFTALGKLPGPFIDQFLQELGPDGLCRALDN